MGTPMSESEKPNDTDGMTTIQKRIQQTQAMSIPEKIALAATGGREVRAILIRDSNKQVREAVLDSPRITETEIVEIASSRTLNEELLRKIVASKQWLKNYQIRLALVNNPNTPLPIGLKLITTLRNGDLKQLAKNNELSDQLIIAAERITTERDQSRTQPTTDEKPKSRYQEIQDLPVPEKIKLAMTGDKELRSLLIKDSNKLVQEAVLDSPRITDEEIAAIANSRTVADELLRKIAGKREWMKNHQVRVALVNNPKTPLPAGLKILNTLMLADLKRLTTNKGISSVLSAAAHRLLLKKERK
jgi:hypothetical protein